MFPINSLLTHVKKTIIFSVAALMLGAGSYAQASFGSVMGAIADTLPGGISDNKEGFFASNWDGMKKILNEGSTGLLLPAYTIHPAWDYPNRRQENGFTWGGGITKNYIDDRGNRRILYAMAFSDSHNNFEPFVGYAWTARWRMANTPLYAELGYTLGITARGDYSWIPFPAPLPLVGVTTDAVGLYGTYVPFTNIFFFFAQITPEKFKLPDLDNSDRIFAQRNEFYVGPVWQKTDMNGVDDVFITSDAGGTFGYRHFFTDNWALDLSYTSSKHDLKTGGRKFGDYRLTSYTATAQYHFQASSNIRLFAGLGGGIFHLDSLKLDPGWSSKKSAVSWVIQSGATYAPTKNLRLTASLDIGVPRFRSHHEESSFSMRPSPSTFKLTAGFAF